MGYERKRGKLSELNALLRGNGKQFFSEIVGNEEILQSVKYVITLDTDTQLPRDAAWKIVATMAHPLNHALYNEKKQRVTEGYGILQPRVAMSIPGSNTSLYARIHGNDQELIHILAPLQMYTRIYLKKDLLLVKEFMMLIFLQKHWNIVFLKTGF